VREKCARDEPFVDADEYDYTCEEHPSGCYVVFKAPGVEYHERPAFRRPPAPGAVEAESFDAQIEAAHAQVRALLLQREREHNIAYERGMN
jgi:hypothetical protein